MFQSPLEFGNILDPNEERDEEYHSSEDDRNLRKNPIQDPQSVRSLLEKKKMVSAAYRNLQQIMGYSETQLERIRDTAASSKRGLPMDIMSVLTELNKDQQLQSSKSSPLKLQDYTIKIWFGSQKLNISKDYQVQAKLMTLFLQTNDEILKHLAQQIEDFQVLKHELTKDIN